MIYDSRNNYKRKMMLMTITRIGLVLQLPCYRFIPVPNSAFYTLLTENTNIYLGEIEVSFSRKHEKFLRFIAIES